MAAYTIILIKTCSKERFNTNFQVYALGWVLADRNGFKVESHSGGLMGMLSLNLMVPDLNPASSMIMGVNVLEKIKI